MRNKFTDLVNAGVASFNPEPIAPDTAGSLNISRTYNNIWGVLTDTHMSYVDGRCIITGTLLSDPDKFCKLCCSTSWGGMVFKTTGWTSLTEFFRTFNFKPVIVSINNQPAAELVPDSDDAVADVKPRAITTSESRLPQHYSVLGNLDECKDCNSLGEMAHIMNRSSIIRGENWHVFDGKLVGFEGNRTLILEVDYEKGIKQECPELQDLLDKEGIGELFVRQFPRYAMIDSDDKQWQPLLRKNKHNRIFTKSFDELTPQQWFEEITYMLKTIN